MSVMQVTYLGFAVPQYVKMKKKILQRHPKSVVCACGTLSSEGETQLNDPDQPDGWLSLTANAFINQLGQYMNGPLNSTCCCKNSLFASLTVTVTITSIH